MAHELTIRSNLKAEMAFVGATPWHGLGQVMQPNAPIEQWMVDAGLDWTIERSVVKYMNGSMHDFAGNNVLYRSDTNAALSIVSDRYHIVQPAQVLEFFRDLVEVNGFSIETAGSLKGGKIIWALARTNFDDEIVLGDEVKTYVLLVTSCDKGLSTTAQYTSVRVVCNNTLHMSLRDVSCANQVKVRHNAQFDAKAVHADLGLNAQEIAEGFMAKMKGMANIDISDHMAESIIERVFQNQGVDGPIRNRRGFQTVMQLFRGAGKGAQMDGVRNTGWGLINAMTEYTDFNMKARNQDYRLSSAWFGRGASMKESVIQLLEEV
jgi:phage/plasmid-like protein (TIGR03299 family)